MSGRVRAVLVEDSATQAAAIRRILEADGDIDVIATAATATAAVEQVARLRPDVAVMDLDIPEGGGRHAIDRIMASSPTPILVLSGIIEEAAAPEAVAALAAGAVEAVPKPTEWTGAHAADLRRMVRRVRGVPVIGRRVRAARQPPPADGEPARRRSAAAVIGIAASTGGPAALARLVAGLRDCGAPILAVQHIHASFADSFANWLAGATGCPVRVARDGERLRAGTVYLAPGDVHLRLGTGRTAEVGPEPAALHRPSADVLFESLARHAGRNAVGVVLTGMGTDGAHGLSAVRAAGGHAFAQDEASSVVFGMPQAAQRAGAVDAFVPLDDLARVIRQVIA